MIRSENAFFLIDHGSGIDLSAQLVSEMLKREQRKEAKIVVLQTHFHMDHINGTPQNWLLFRPGTLLHYYSPDLSPFRPSTEHSVGFSGMEHVLRAYFNPSGTYFPVPLDRLPSQQEFTKFEVGKTLNLGDGQAYTIPSKHPGGCCAYRIELPKCKPIVILTDYEPDLEPDRAMVDFIDGAGLLLVDMQYTDDEYEGTKPIGGMQMPRVGWGHGTPRRVFPTVLACKHPPAVRIVHHDPRKSDADLDLFYEHSVDVLEELSGSKKLPFNYQFARGADAYWL
jgi:ribonuclease BN (tRNA processing enzyme)